MLPARLYPVRMPVRCLLSIAILAGAAGAQQRWYVDDDAPMGGDGKSWASAFRGLDEALHASAHLDEIWVAAGRYAPRERQDPADPRSASFVFGNNKQLYGGFAGNEQRLAERAGLFAQTLLDGELGLPQARDDNAYHVITMKGKMLVDGFRIANGQADGPLSGSRGGAILAEGGFGNQATFVRCIFNANQAVQGGALHAQNSILHFVDCRFTRNRALSLGGAVRAQAAYITCVNSVFEFNSAVQGGAFSLSSIQLNPISVRMMGCIFDRNRAELGGAAHLGASQLSSGAALWGNCTFWHNEASDTAGAIYAKTDSAHPAINLLFNCIVWENRAPNSPGLFGRQSLNWSLVQGNGSAGNHNFEADPWFVDPEGGDFHLLPGSPAIDSGANPLVLEDFSDLDGDGIVLEPCPFAPGGVRRFIDEPATPDTGLGPAPIVDRGACEN